RRLAHRRTPARLLLRVGSWRRTRHRFGRRGFVRWLRVVRRLLVVHGLLIGPDFARLLVSLVGGAFCLALAFLRLRMAIAVLVAAAAIAASAASSAPPA